MFKLINLSGVDTIGRNAHALIVDKNIYILDYGFGFLDYYSFGIDFALPNSSWLIKNKKNIKGIFLSHAHLDHIMGVPFVIDKLGYPPIYGSAFTIELLRKKLKEFRKLAKARLITVPTHKVMHINNIDVEFIHVTHSIPQSRAIYLSSKYGSVFYSGDFKLDEKPIIEAQTDMESIERVAKKGITVAMLDSTNVFIDGSSTPESKIVFNLESIIKSAEGRVIITTFASLVNRIVGIIHVARSLGRKVVVTGRSIKDNLRIAKQIGYARISEDDLVSEQNAKQYPDNKLIIIATGSQGEENAALLRMAKTRHAHLGIKKGDTVILASSSIPGNVYDIQQMLDVIASRGAKIINATIKEVHVSGHAYQKDIVKMARMLNAKYYIPVHGYPSFLYKSKELLSENGISSNKIFVPRAGAVWELRDGRLVSCKSVEATPILVVDSVEMSIKDPLLQDRKLLSRGGILEILAVLDKKDKIQSVKVNLRGVVPQALTQKTQGDILTMAETLLKGKLADVKKMNSIKMSVYKKISGVLLRRYNLQPLINFQVIRAI